MNATLKEARTAVRAYLAGIDQDQDFLTFIRLYVQASNACAAAGVTLGQLRAQMSKGGAR
jgi:hypothetical protein